MKQKKEKELDDLLDLIPQEISPPVETEYKNKVRVYVLSGQIKDLYGKIITEHDLNKMSEQECENIYKICELKIAQRISDSVVDGIITLVGSLFSSTLPIDNKDKYISDLKNDYIINSELKHVAGNIAMRTGRLMGLLEFGLITFSHVKLNRKKYKNLTKNLKKTLKNLRKNFQKKLTRVLILQT